MERVDVLVVGAGPAGSVAARAAALGGAKTLLVDRRPELGTPVQCGEFVPARDELLDIFPFPELVDRAFTVPPGSILRETRSMACVAPGGRRYRFPLRGFSVSRRRFDQALAGEAVRAGAELRHPAGVTRIVDGVASFANGGSVEARVVIGADGPLSTVARSAGFAPPRSLYRMITATLPGAFDDEIALYFGRVAPGGYAWVIPKDGEANVGLGVTELRRGESLGRLLGRFLGGEGLGAYHDPTQWWVPIGPPPGSLVHGRSLFVGDAANAVMATNGGGIPTAMMSGWEAGDVAARNVRDGTPLSEYDRRFDRRLRAPLARGDRIKRSADRFAGFDPLLALGMRYIGPSGLDSVMRMRWPARLGGNG